MPTARPETILLTGVTGFLGRHLLWSFLRRDADTKIHCLLRPENGCRADQRLQTLIARHRDTLPAGASARCHAVSGDIVAPDLGLDSGARERLLGEVDRIVHCAATVEFDTPLAESRRTNVGGTQHVLHLADELLARGRLRRVDHFSTAFVAGTTVGRTYEDRLTAASFNNTYEQTKWEAEQLVRDAQQRLPITIYRPSIIVGDSKTGYTSNFRVLYWPLKALASGLVIAVPADPDGIVDVVPIDHVVEAFEALSRTEQSVGKCYHLAAGAERQSSFGELLRMTSAFFGVRAPWTIPPRISYRVVRPLLYATVWGKRRALLRLGELYFPYFSYRASFDRTAARADLSGSGIEPPPVADYFHAIMQYCVETDWGRIQRR
ncbi:MAG TPA: SDR family oxidoreductase [Candidatus Kryptonia bacterium]|nr:SDR family oxidoreductase [Candidatus Kryptonia bacterium]